MNMQITPRIRTAGQKIVKSIGKSLVPLSVGILIGVSSSSVLHYRKAKKFAQVIEPKIEYMHNTSMNAYNAMLDYQEKLNTANTLDFYRAQQLCLLHGLPIQSMSTQKVIETADSLLLNSANKPMYKPGANNAEKVEAFK